VSARRDLGFTGLLAAGRTPQEAWQIIHDDTAASPEARAIFADLAATEDGRAALDWARAAWARHGLPPPWEDPPDRPAPQGGAR
jgi:hypothetical protein